MHLHLHSFGFVTSIRCRSELIGNSMEFVPGGMKQEWKDGGDSGCGVVEG